MPRRCQNCQEMVTPLPAELCQSGPHYQVQRCPMCEYHMGFLPKPETDATKYRRPSAHRELVEKFGHGFCEMCELKVEELPKGDSLQGHHVREFAEEGEATRENIWILCTACHRLVSYQRRYRRDAIRDTRKAVADVVSQS